MKIARLILFLEIKFRTNLTIVPFLLVIGISKNHSEIQTILTSKFYQKSTFKIQNFGIETIF